MSALILLALLLDSSHAYDWGDREATFYLYGDHYTHCLRDTTDDCIEVVEPIDHVCQGDAAGSVERDWVWKVPNRTTWSCDIVCSAEYAMSELIMIGARMKNGWNEYGSMSLEQFMDRMGNRAFCDRR